MLAYKNDQNNEKDIYYLSYILIDYELSYVYIEKVFLAMIFITKKIRYYMLNHTTYMIYRDNPLKYMMSKA